MSGTDRKREKSSGRGSGPRGEGYYESHRDVHRGEKEAVAEYIVKHLIDDGNSVVLDAGTSATRVADAIFHSERRNLSIMTHNMDVFLNYSPVFPCRKAACPEAGIKPIPMQGHQLLLTGGCFNDDYNALFGELTVRAYEVFNPTVAIISVSGLTASLGPGFPSGVYCHADVETPVKERLFRIRAERKIVVADASKIGRTDSYLFGDLSDIKSMLPELGKAYVITTGPRANEPPEVWRAFEGTMEALREVDIEVVIVLRSESDDSTTSDANAPRNRAARSENKSTRRGPAQPKRAANTDELRTPKGKPQSG